MPIPTQNSSGLVKFTSSLLNPALPGLASFGVEPLPIKSTDKVLFVACVSIFSYSSAVAGILIIHTAHIDSDVNPDTKPLRILFITHHLHH